MSQVYQNRTLGLPCLGQFAAQTPLCEDLVTLRDICFCRRHAEAETSQLVMPNHNRFCQKAVYGMFQQWVTALLQFLGRL